MDYRVIVAGSRHFNNYKMLCERLDRILSEKLKTHNVIIVSGMARGADNMGERYARERKLLVHRYPAEWDKYGKSAGHKRNRQMAENADACVAFWANGSRGTASMIKIATELALDLRTIKID